MSSNPPTRTILSTLGDGRVVDIDSEKGHAVLEFLARPEFCHPGGVIQGGFVTGWIDSAMAHAIIAHQNGTVQPATLELKISFYEPTLPGARVRAEAWIERMGKAVAFVAGRLLNEEGAVLASGTSTVRLRRMQPR